MNSINQEQYMIIVCCNVLSCRNSKFSNKLPLPSIYIADMHGIYKSKYPLLIKKMSFEGKHYKIETVVPSRSAQAPNLKKTYS